MLVGDDEDRAHPGAATVEGGEEVAESAAAAAAPPSGRLLVKLKLPKTTEEEEEEREELMLKKSHYCAECNRSFSSGKALGGHMSSAHVQANKDLSLRKLKSKMKRYHDQRGPGEIICNICGKDFPSRKSIFGHMRCHPERKWRGMEPPHPTKTDSMETEDSTKLGTDDTGLIYHEEFYEDHEHQDDSGPVLDLGEPLKNWGVKAKRGRRAIDRDPDPEENEFLNAVHQLIRLVNDDWGKRKAEVQEETEMSDEDHHVEYRVSGLIKRHKSDDFSSGKLKISEESLIDHENSDVGDGVDARKFDDNGKKETPFPVSMNSPPKDNECDCKDTVEIQTKGDYNCRAKTQKKLKMAVDSEEETSEFSFIKRDSSILTPSKFSCTISKKKSETHQALGGQRSSHDKFKITIYDTSDQHTNQESQKEKNKYANTTTTTVPTTNELGSRIESAEGDKRSCHSNNPVDDQVCPSRVISADGSILTARKGIDLDLNEMPNAEDEDGVQ